MTFNSAALDWLSQVLHVPADTLAIERMAGATSSSVYLLRSDHPCPHCPCVLRVLDNLEWLAEEPDIIPHEAAALREAEIAGLPAPRMVAFSDSDVGFGAPALVMAFMEGAVFLRPTHFAGWLRGLAEQLAKIHRHQASGFPWQYRSWVNRAAIAPPAWSARADAWERAIEIALGPAPPYTPVFIHRDFHPVNVLWRGDTISGVVDWINACRGPAGVDLAHCRMNLAVMYGPEIAERFLNAYEADSPQFEYHPFWDLDSILDTSLPEPTFYPPWRDYGLPEIPRSLLRERVECHLLNVLRGVAAG